MIKRVRRSPTFTWSISEGAALSHDAVAFDYFKKRKLDTVAQPVPADAWLSPLECDVSDVEIVEHAEVIPEPGWGGVLSLLWIPEASAVKLGDPE